jgi:3-oxoacyl-[acyl-carrier protein] reductase
MKLKDKVALITGASKGIGHAVALEFAKEGAIVIVNYHNSKQEADNLVSEIKKLNSDALAIKADISKEDEIKALVTQVVDKFGHINILVNNAGIVFDIPWMEKTVEQWHKTLDTNLIGTFLCCKYAVPHMPDGSRIINISSTNGLGTVSTESMDYDASKAGMIAITKSLAKELAPNILVNSIAPGWVDTDINKYLPKDYVKSEEASIGVKRFGRPEEIAKMALFLASADSSYVVGTTLIVDGGMVY